MEGEAQVSYEKAMQLYQEVDSAIRKTVRESGMHAFLFL
jgi:hypothetical protein